MESIPTVYPDFVPNQILTSTQLNDLRHYLDVQTRVGRVRLAGTGIACGLSIEQQGTVAEVESGFGVTSDGYLADVTGRAYDYYRPYVDPDHDATGTPDYEAWQRSGDLTGQLALAELLDSTDWADGKKPSDARKLTNSVLANKVVAVYLEATSVELDSCLVTDCDNEGRNVLLEPRVLLIGRADLEALQPCDGHRPPERLTVGRLHTALRLADVADSDDIDRAYAELVAKVTDDLVAAVRDAFDRYGAYLDLDDDSSGEIGDVIRRGITDGLAGQYGYDLAKDFITAYDEMATAACKLVGDCAPAADHPRHLLLGALDDAVGYRHRWTASPVRDVVDGDRQRVRDLFRRIGAMADAAAKAIVAGGLEGVVFTPSHGEHVPLGHRAIPRYYAPTDELVTLWHPSTCCRSGAPWGAPGRAEPEIDHDYTRSTLIRVEGHLGLERGAAADLIDGLRRDHNVEFDLLTVEIDANPADESEVNDAVDALHDGERNWHRFWEHLQEQLDPEMELGEAIELLERLLDEFLDQLGDIGEGDLATGWRDQRCREQILCDTGKLELDYLAARANLLGDLSAVDGVLRRLPGRRDVKERMSEARAAIAFDWLSLLVSSVRLRRSVEGLRHELSKELCRFNVQTFGARLRHVVSDLAAIDLQTGRMPVMTRAELDTDALAALLADVRAASCGLVGRVQCAGPIFDAIDAAYRQLRAHGAAVLSRLGERAPGLEHLAGVERGGTFVIVCADDAVVADFSLAGPLSCCCSPDLDALCLPPSAAVDAVVVDVEFDTDKGVAGPVSASIDLAANHRDHDNPTGSREDSIRLGLEHETTELGGRIDLDDAGVVRYEIEQPLAGSVDRFTYVVETKCDRRRGAVVVYLRPDFEQVAEPRAEPRPEPPADPGRVAGRLLVDGKPSAAKVTLDPALSNARVTGAAAESGFTFDEVAPGVHTVRAVEPERSLSGDRVISVASGAVVDATISLSRSGGGLGGRVTAPDGRVAGSVLDVATGPRKAPFTNLVVDDTGTFELSGLDPGTYWVRDPEKRVPPTMVEVAKEIETVNIVLARGG